MPFFVLSEEAILLFRIARAFGQKPSSWFGLDGLDALFFDEAIWARGVQETQEAPTCPLIQALGGDTP